AGDGMHLLVGRRVDEDRHLAAEAVVVRLDEVQRVAGGDGGVDGVAALVEHALPGAGGEVVAGGGEAAPAHGDGGGGEGHGCFLRKAQWPGYRSMVQSVSTRPNGNGSCEKSKAFRGPVSHLPATPTLCLVRVPLIVMTLPVTNFRASASAMARSFP